MNRAGDGGPDLERLLERDLTRVAEGLTGPSGRPSQSMYHRFRGRPGSIRTRFASRAAFSRAAVGLCAAVLLASAGAAGAAAATGSPNPGVWGATVSRAVATCEGSLP